jgi:hypothetical protein
MQKYDSKIKSYLPQTRQFSSQIDADLINLVAKAVASNEKEICFTNKY